MDPSPAHLALEDAAATLRRIWAFMLQQFGNLRIEPARQAATARWLCTKFRRFEALIARYQAGKLRVRAAPREVTPGEKTVRRVVNKPEFRMPRKWGWLLDSGKHHAAYHHGQIRMVLERPEILELLEAYPHAKQMVRPLCRAFGVDLPWAMDRPRAARMPRVRKTRLLYPEDPRMKLPRGVKTWIRKQKALERAIKGRDELVRKMGLARRV